MKLAELIVAEARERGVRHFFGIPGGGSPLDMMEAGRQMGVDFVTVAHESSAPIAAGVYGSLKNTAGLALAVKGVGVGNLVGGAANMYFERRPVVCVCETSPTNLRQKDLVQHTDHSGLLGAVVKNQTVLGAGDQSVAIQDAVFHATEGRPGPVLVELPSDLGDSEAGIPLPSLVHDDSVVINEARVREANEIISLSKRPLVYAGSDVIRSGALRELRGFVESVEAAVLVTMEARGVFPEDHSRYVGVYRGSGAQNLSESEVLGKADLAIFVGVDAMMTHVPWSSSVPTIEVSARPEYSSMSDPQVRINGDLSQVLEMLNDTKVPGFPQEEITAINKRAAVMMGRPSDVMFTIQDIIGITRECLPSDGILISETGAFVGVLEHMWTVTLPGRYLGTSGGRSMGLMLPGILGANLASPGVPMIGLGADGSLLMRLGELEVISRMGVAVPIVIVNDQALGTMKWRQNNRGMPDYGLDLQPVDFEAIARACGLAAATVTNPDDFRTELKRATQRPVATLIDARVDREPFWEAFGRSQGVY